MKEIFMFKLSVLSGDEKERFYRRSFNKKASFITFGAIKWSLQSISKNEIMKSIILIVAAIMSVIFAQTPPDDQEMSSEGIFMQDSTFGPLDSLDSFELDQRCVRCPRRTPKCRCFPKRRCRYIARSCNQCPTWTCS